MTILIDWCTCLPSHFFRRTRNTNEPNNSLRLKGVGASYETVERRL